MYLKSLTIQGFKSFPDKTVLTFGPGITAVVGPNGSGKSNISDAIRWVLGEMSAKSLRGGRMEDVIFGGTPRRRALGSAEVRLCIDNTDRALAVDSDEVTVARRYYRSGESEYLLGGAQVRLRDIYELFMDTGLGHEGYAVIGQGRIAEIVGARSDERREIFEEAAGIAKFRFRKEDAERRLAATEENLVRLRDLLGELEARVGPLREQAEKAKRFLALAAEKKALEVGLWLHTMDVRRGELREAQNKLGIAHAQYDTLEAALAETEKEIEETYMRAQKTAADAERLRAAAAQDEQSAVQAEAQAAVAAADAARAAQAGNEADEERARLLAQSGEQQQALRALQEELRRQQAQRQSLQQTLEACEHTMEALARAGDEQTRRSREASVCAAQADAQNAALKEQRAALQSAAQGMQERLAQLAQGADTRAARLEQAQKALKEMETDAARAAQDAQAKANALEGCALKLKARRERLTAADERVRTLSLQQSERAQRADMLAEMERSLEGFAHSVRAVVREGRRGALSGILGPISQLLHADGKTAVAVETALGAAAQHVVVETEENAKGAIRFLKQSDGGRATFLPLSSVRGGVMDARELSRMPGFVGIAAELVTYEPRFRDIAGHLLGRTAVAEDLDTAVAMARQFHYRFRIVTLDGQQVNPGGSLTGGSRRPGAGLVSRAAEIAALRTQAAKLQTALDEARQTQAQAKQTLSAAEAEQNGARAELAAARETAVRLAGERKRLAEQAGLLGADMQTLEAERQQARIRAEALREQQHTVESELLAAEKAAVEAHRALETCGAESETLAARRTEQTARLSELRLRALAADKDADALRARMETLRAGETERAERAESLAVRMRALEEEAAQKEESETALLEKAAHLRAQARKNTAQAQEQTQARDTLEQRAAALRSGARAKSDEKEAASRELARLEERRAALQSGYDELVAKLWETYELTRAQAEQQVARLEHPEEAARRLDTLKHDIKALGSVNVSAIDEYREVSERYETMKTQVDDVETSKSELESLIRGLTSEMRAQFSRKFEEIAGHFSTIFVELFGGGHAELTLAEPDDALASGIDIHVQPPGKIIKNLAALSGGEQAFVAIALYFALLKVRPSPFCVLDEIEAALDEQNVVRYAAYLRRLCGSTQFIVITHRRGTMDAADTLYGVTMQNEGVSRLLTLHLDELVRQLGLEGGAAAPADAAAETNRAT